MKFSFIGVGSAFTKKYWQSNMLIEIPVGNQIKRLLVDCGTTAHYALADFGQKRDSKPLKVADIDALYISHPHADHIGGIEEFALMSYFNPRKKEIWKEDRKGLGRPSLYIAESFADELWNESLKGGLSTLQNQVATLDTYFDVHRIPKNNSFLFGGFEFQLVQVLHVVTGFSFMHSYGLIFHGLNEKVFLTTDAQHCPHQIQDFYNDVTLIFQDCETGFPSGVHANYSELKTLPEQTKAKMYLYHYSDGELPNAVEDGFAGFVSQGQEFDL